MPSRSGLPALYIVLAVIMGACAAGTGSAARPGPIVLGGISDQNVQVLEERFDGIARTLTEQVGIPFEYQPSTPYVAVVTAFQNDDLLLGWFGGLTGVQARLAVPGAEAVAQRPIDTEFRSVFVVNGDVEATAVRDLEGLTFTFGSESSTSGHLMPRFFLQQAGLDPVEDFAGQPGFSGSHDKTWKLVESGSFQAGALNAAVWESAVADGRVDTSRIRVLETTPTYVDYHWVVHPAIDDRYGAGTTRRIVEAGHSAGATPGSDSPKS